MASHLAAVVPAIGKPFEVRSRPTPTPGPGELLIEVKSVAINPADGIMRDMGIHVPSFPTVIGFDMAGLVLQTGDEVPAKFTPNETRVAAYSAAVFKSCDPDYGAFQQKCLVPWQHAVLLPSEGISWNQAATLPMSVQVPLSAWDCLGIPRLGEATASVIKPKREALLIWGASSSVGTMGVQTARLLKQDPGSAFAAVYATGGEANHKYVHSLGADRVFDYKDPKVVEAIISAAKNDGLIIRHCFLGMGQIALCQAVLEAFVGEDQSGIKAKIGSAPPIPADTQQLDGVETIFVLPSMADEGLRLGQFRYWLGTFLKEQLAQQTIKPSPEPRVVGIGLKHINSGCDEILRGVSCSKLVVEIGQ